MRTFWRVMAWLKNLRLNSKDPEVRSKAVENLNGAGNAHDTDRIFASLSDESPQVRCAAIHALEKSHNHNSVRSLIEALVDPSYQVREAAARALGHLRDVTSIDPLVASLKDPEPGVRTAAAYSLQALAWMPVTEEELVLFDIALGKSAARVSPTDDADPFLSEPYSSPAFESSSETESSADANNSETLRMFLAGLGDVNPGIRISSIRALATIPGQEITQRILRLFRDRDPAVKLAAIQGLAKRDDPAPAFFLGLLDDPIIEIRLAAIQFLARIRHSQVAEALLPLLSDAEPKIRQASAAALGAIGNVCAVESLVVSLIDEDAQVRQAAEKALEQIDPNWLLSVPTQAARAQIEATLSICSAAARAAIGQVLARLPAPTAATAIASGNSNG